MKKEMKGSKGGAKWAEGVRQPPVAPKRSRRRVSREPPRREAAENFF
jgi:hypothetical protein